jgi:methionyl-tRNA formyltransferase
MRIVFFGTPEFAVPSLKALLAAGLEVAAVVTQPDKPQGRSRSKLFSSPTKLIAEDLDIPVLQPVKPVGDVFAQTLRRFDSDLGVVVAYGHILRPEILSTPRLGMINVHASLLPHLRGAAPIQWSILNGEQETGISVMQMEAGLDSGPVYHRAAITIGGDETGGELTQRLALVGAAGLIETVTALNKVSLKAAPQDHTLATYAPKIDRRHTRLVWSEGSDGCARRIRAFDPEPGAWTTFDGHEIKLFGARVHQLRDLAGHENGKDPGTVLQTGDRLSVSTGSGALMVREVQPSGKRRMPVADWLRGRSIAPGKRFE